VCIQLTNHDSFVRLFTKTVKALLDKICATFIDALDVREFASRRRPSTRAHACLCSGSGFQSSFAGSRVLCVTIRARTRRLAWLGLNWITIPASGTPASLAE